MRVENIIFPLTSSHLRPPSYVQTRQAKVPRAKYLGNELSDYLPVEDPRYVGRYIDYPARYGGSSISLSTFPWRRPWPNDALPVLHGRAKHIQPTTSRPSNRPPDRPTAGVCTPDDVDFDRSRGCSQVTLGYDLLFFRALYSDAPRGWRALRERRGRLPRA